MSLERREEAPRRARCHSSNSAVRPDSRPHARRDVLLHVPDRNFLGGEERDVPKHVPPILDEQVGSLPAPPYNEPVMKSGFLDKLIERLGRIGPEEVQNYLLQLAQEKGLIETVFNAIQEGIIVTDAKGRITYVNDAACELFGLEAEKSIGKRLDERVRGLDWNSLSQSEGAISRDMEIFYPANRFLNFYIVPLLIERRTPKDDGSTPKAFASGTESRPTSRGANSHAEPVGHAIILRDITESRRSTEKTIESERFNALTLLAAGVAHEIGNPLNSLHIHLQLMERKVRKLDGKVKEELQEAIAISRAEITRLDSIVSQFLQAIRPSKPVLHPENVNAIVEEAVRFFSPEIEDRDIVVEQELRSDLPLLELDRDQMKQVFYNVIKNSFEAMKRRGILRIRTDMDATHVNVSFTDTGGGMSAESLSRVFDPYFTTKSSGSGLGLLIVRRIVREHGGEMAIESNEGKGLTLTIRLPYLDKRVRMLEAGTSNAEGGMRNAESQ
jgi:two-component system, sporulation sensor kinase E